MNINKNKIIKQIIKFHLSELEKELNRFSEESSFRKFSDKFENSNCQDQVVENSALSVLLNYQQYSIEQFFYDGLKLTSYDSIANAVEKYQFRENYIAELTITADKIKNTIETHYADEYKMFMQEKLKFSYLQDTDLNCLLFQQAFQSMFMLKAHYIKFELFDEEEETYEESRLVINFLKDYRKFLELKKEELNRIYTCKIKKVEIEKFKINFYLNNLQF